MLLTSFVKTYVFNSSFFLINCYTKQPYLTFTSDNIIFNKNAFKLSLHYIIDLRFLGYHGEDWIRPRKGIC